MEKKKDQIIILGELKNEGKDTFSSVEVEADFFDKNQNLIKIEAAILSGGVKPGATRPFQIIKCCDKDNFNDAFGEFDHYELIIVNGYIKQGKIE